MPSLDGWHSRMIELFSTGAPCMDRPPGWIAREDREPTAFPGSIVLLDGQRFAVTITDISREGCQIECAGTTLPIGQAVRLESASGQSADASVRWALLGRAGAPVLTIRRVDEARGSATSAFDPLRTLARCPWRTRRPKAIAPGLYPRSSPKGLLWNTSLSKSSMPIEQWRFRPSGRTVGRKRRL